MLDTTGVILTPGAHQFLIKAVGYEDVTVTVTVAAPLTPPTITGQSVSATGIKLDFIDNPDWRSKITGVYQNGNSVSIHASRIKRNVAGEVTLDFTGAALSPGTHQFVIKANGYEDVTLTVTVAAPLAPPTITVQSISAFAVTFNFTDNADWRSKITGVYQNGNSVSIHSSRIKRNVAGQVTLDFTGAALAPGTHRFVIKADGYEDVTVTINVAAPLAPPTITGQILNPTTVIFNFSDNADWRSKITGVYQNGNSASIHPSRINKNAAGQVTLDLTGITLAPGTHKFLIKADGYQDVMVEIN